MTSKTDMLQFMVVRAPNPPDPGSSRKAYIRDDLLDPNGRVDADLFSINSDSRIGKLVYDEVFCNHDERRESNHYVLPDAAAASAIFLGLLDLLEVYQPQCPNTATPKELRLEDLPDLTYFANDNNYYIVPDRLRRLPAPLAPALAALLPLLGEAAATTPPGNFDPALLRKSVQKIFDGQPLLRDVVFENGRYSERFLRTKRILFDALYLLYVLRRRVSVNLEEIINGLRALHGLEGLAIDEFVAALLKQQGTTANDTQLLRTLVSVVPSLAGWTFGALPAGLPLIATVDDVAVYLSATPVVHPLFAKLHAFRASFNPIRPLGVGDLKVVKQWLCGYEVGEIAHIDNVLLREEKTRVYRHLEKNEDTSTYTNEQQEETQKDTQSTDRFELKREAEEVVKSDLAVNAGLNVNVSYQGTGYAIVSTVSGGFAYSRSQTEQSKVASNFAKEVVDKSVKRVQSRVSLQRTSTRLFETEETDTHSFDNKQGTGHVSGLYRWLDKKYRAQLYNFGKRMMFEFILPEPAAFLVESRLRSFEAMVDVPQPPKKPTPAGLPIWLTSLTPTAINQQKFEQLRQQYDLSDFTYPVRTRRVELVDSATGKSLFSERNMESSTWQTRTFTCRLNAKDYRLTNLIVDGWVYFWGRVGSGEAANAPPNEINTLDIYVAGQRVFRQVNNSVERWFFGSNFGSEYPVANSAPFDADDVSLTLGLWDPHQFDLSFHADLELSAQALGNWQTEVYRKIREFEQKSVDDQNSAADQAYQSGLATYRNRLAQLRAAAVNELLQGQSEAANRQVMLEELKRQCLAMLTKEFDDYEPDDLLTPMEAMGSRSVEFQYHHFKIDETPDSTYPNEAKASFQLAKETADYPAPDRQISAFKGRYIQFLEQAFEWQHLAYLFYPYFWATPPKWIELMNRGDDSDPNLTAFLRAGSARVLIAVIPAYDEAVLHYLATGEPWDGGPAPVIGDPLYIPLYEELRNQQDDLENATPEGEPWTFTLPTSLVYLENSSTPLPPDQCP